MSGQSYNADRYEETDNAIRFAHEGGTGGKSRQQGKNNLAQFSAHVEEILKGYFSQNKKQNSLCMLLGRIQRDNPAVIKLVDKVYIFPFSHKFFYPLEKLPFSI